MLVLRLLTGLASSGECQRYHRFPEKRPFAKMGLRLTTLAKDLKQQKVHKQPSGYRCPMIPAEYLHSGGRHIFLHKLGGVGNSYIYRVACR